MNTFKKGDRVRILDMNNAAMPTDSVGEVRAKLYPDMECFVVKFSNNSEYNYWDYMLELIKDMSTEIEVGDLINGGFGDLRVLSVGKKENGSTYTDYEYLSTGAKDWGYFNSTHIKSKANKSEIVGYELLKDLPGIPAGTIGKQNDFDGNIRFQINPGTPKLERLDIHLDKMKDTTWFKPVYKPKEVVVKISKGREVKLQNNSVILPNQGKASFENIQELVAYFKVPSKKGRFDVTIDVFHLGCQEFTKEDIQLVYQAIQSLK